MPDLEQDKSCNSRSQQLFTRENASLTLCSQHIDKKLQSAVAPFANMGLINVGQRRPLSYDIVNSGAGTTAGN